MPSTGSPPSGVKRRFSATDRIPCCRNGPGNAGRGRSASPPSGYWCTFTVALTKCGAQRAFRDLQLAVGTRRNCRCRPRALPERTGSRQIQPGHRDERAAFLFRLHREPRVVRRYISVAQPGVGCIHRRDPGQRQLLRHPILQGLEQTLRAAARLRRIRRDMLDAQMRQRAPDLRRLATIHLAARFGRVKVMAAAIGIQAQRQAVLAEHLQQAPGTSRPCLLPRPATPNRSRSSRRPSSRSDRAPAGRRATRAASRPDAASSPAADGAAACAGARRAAAPSPADPAACRNAFVQL